MVKSPFQLLISTNLSGPLCKAAAVQAFSVWISFKRKPQYTIPKIQLKLPNQERLVYTGSEGTKTNKRSCSGTPTNVSRIYNRSHEYWKPKIANQFNYLGGNHLLSCDSSQIIALIRQSKKSELDFVVERVCGPTQLGTCNNNKNIQRQISQYSVSNC